MLGTRFSQSPRQTPDLPIPRFMPGISHSSVSGINTIFKGKEWVRGKIIMVPAAVCCKKWLNYASSFFSLALSDKNNCISNNLSKLKDTLGPGVYQTLASGRCRESHGICASLGATEEARARQGRPAARGGYAPRGSCPASSGRQSASGRSGPAGRWAGRRRDGTPQASHTSTRARSRATPAGPSLRARDPLGTSPGQGDSAARPPSPDSAARRGAARRRGRLCNARTSQRPAELGWRADLGPRAGEEAKGP